VLLGKNLDMASPLLLTGVRVLELGEMVAVPFAGKQLAELGAEVVKIEPPDGDRSRHYGPYPPGHHGDPERSGLFLGLNTNKDSIVLDFDRPADVDRLHQLVGEADIVLHGLRPSQAEAVGLDADALIARHPSLVTCAITPFGSTGPHAEWHAEEITVVHGGGWGYLIPGDAPDDSQPPLTVFGHPAHCQAGLAAAFAAVGAFVKADTSGCGDHIDFSIQAHVASMLESHFIAWSYQQNISRRHGGRLLNPWGIYECADGLIFLVTVEQDQWERLVEMMGSPDWATAAVFATQTDRAANRDVLDIYLNEWTRGRRVDELFHAGQEQRICFAPVFTMADLAEQQHLHDRGFFTDINHEHAGVLRHMERPYKINAGAARREHRGAPTLGSGTGFRSRPAETSKPTSPGSDRMRPLEGVRVVDFSWVWAGPFCTMHLAYLGAEVIKIESSGRPGLGRRLPIHPLGVEPSLDTCGYFNQWDQGKKSIELDLSDPAGVQRALALVATADVVVDNYATGVMDRLGLSDAALREANPDVIIASITGYGHTGPLAHYMGYGPTTAPLSGLTAMTGHVGGRPEEAGISFGDPAAGMTAAFAIAAGLAGRARGSDPARIDVSLWEATAANAVELWMRHALDAEPIARMGNRNPNAAPYGLFPCAGDDTWVSIACVSDSDWEHLAALGAIDDPRFASLAGRKEHEDDLESIVASFTTTQDPWALTTTLQQAGIAAYPSLSCADLEHDPQLVARQFWERFDHPATGPRTHSGIPWQMKNSGNGVMRRAPLLGEHTTEVLDQLG
jgi:crotonobetainyl-CoA:carnitine CoA-transferase CaiB-like acyl-CoA transferase